jgi:hypothetical protein
LAAVADQTSIKAGKARVLGIDQEASGLLNVEVPLEPKPDEYWTEIFISGPPGPVWPISMHPAHLSGGTVELRPPDRELDKYLEELNTRIESTNRSYAQEIAPKIKAEQERQKSAAEESKRRIEEARRRLDERDQ